LRLCLFTIDWLWSLSLLSTPIHSPIFSNYESYLFYPFLYIMSIFLSFLYISIHFVNLVHSVQFYPCWYPFYHFMSIPIHLVNSFQFVQICSPLLFIPIH
jgi:hypothetical protein